MITICVGGKEYPADITMGAMLRYKRETGKEPTDIKDMIDMLHYCHCCYASCLPQGETPLDLQTWADQVTPASFNAWALALQHDTEKEKKTE